MVDTDSRELYSRIYTVVEHVPPGKVATYGDVAAIVGGGCDARTAGYALNEIPKARSGQVPWQRIINSSGGISTRGTTQRALLEQEGVVFDARDRIDLTRYRWDGPDAEWARAHGCNTLPLRGEDDSGDQLRLF